MTEPARDRSDDGSRVTWESQEEREDWLPLLAVMLRLPAALDARLRSSDGLALTEVLVMSFLSDAADLSERMTTIAHASHLSAPRTSQLIGRMEKRGFVTRAPALDDGRAIVATLTPKGLAVLRAATPGYEDDVRRRVLARLTTKQLTQLRGIVAAIDTSRA